MELWMARAYRKSKVAVLSVAWSLLLVQGIYCPALGQVLSPESQAAASDTARIRITSDPSARRIVLDGRNLEQTTPALIELSPGQYSLTVEAQGYDSLSHDLVVIAGQQVALRFVLLKEPPVQPTPAELRARAQSYASADGVSSDNPEVVEREEATKEIKEENDRCAECHLLIPKLYSESVHRTMPCSECHGSYSEHAKDGEVIGAMQVARGGGDQILCLECHDGRGKTKSRANISKVAVVEHLQEKRVRSETLCNQCHHVHAPQKWVYESREMVGLPQLMRRLPPMDENVALETKERFNSLAESFVVVPLSVGVIGTVAFDEDSGFPSSVLLVAGVILSAGSYVLGKVFYARRLANIRETNIQREAANKRAIESNQRVERAMEEYYRTVTRWVEESEGRGVVIVRDQTARN